MYPDVYGVQNVTGTFNASTLRVSVAGLPVIIGREFAANETENAIVTNRAAIAWAEDGPRLMTADSVQSLGRNIAIYGYGAATPFIGSGIVKIYNQP